MLASTMTSMEIVNRYFGFDTMRDGQGEAISALLEGRDTLAVMPTGAGKSLCYQAPAMLLPGVTLVISPLISLMRDQVLSLTSIGIPAAYLNSSLTDSQLTRATENALAAKYKLIYTAPERLLSKSMMTLARGLRISMIAVDEAHCISHWGQDFRTSYLDIPRFTAALTERPVLAAFTATATERVRRDISKALGLSKPLILVKGYDRPNLYFEVKQPENKYTELLQYISGRPGSGIIYCATRRQAESVARGLTSEGHAALLYHAGLSEEERSRAQDDFLSGRSRLIAATNAFGMGIDKNDVRFVVHFSMPQSLESYYQEAGRAGRDGLPAECILYYSREDVNTALSLISKSKNRRETARRRSLIRKMEQYCEADGCLRQYILSYFGERVPADCGNCGNCAATPKRFLGFLPNNFVCS